MMEDLHSGRCPLCKLALLPYPQPPMAAQRPAFDHPPPAQPPGVSLVEDLYKGREPLQLAAVYFISPTPAAVARLVADFARNPLYPSVHIFFSSR